MTCPEPGCVREQPGHKIHSTAQQEPKSSATAKRLRKAVANALANLAEEFERDGMLTAAERTRAKIPKDI
jgi:hypothetical protein